MSEAAGSDRQTKAPSGSPRYDVVIAGGGPAGLSAALILGRARRSVLLCDTGSPRSWTSKALHAYLGLEGIDPGDFRRSARQELAAYASITLRDAEVTSGERTTDGFRVTLDGAGSVACRKLLIATGVRDRLPPLEGIEALFGTSVFQCPYCDGWEMRDRPTAVYGRGKAVLEMARTLTAWTKDIAVCTDGSARFAVAERAALARNGIEVVEERIARLDRDGAELRAVVFRGGRVLPRTALFFELPAEPQSRLAQTLGCRLSRRGRVARGRYEAASIPGVYVAGNVIDDVQLSIVAAAEGARAAFGINLSLTREDFDARAGTPAARNPEH